MSFEMNLIQGLHVDLGCPHAWAALLPRLCLCLLCCVLFLSCTKLPLPEEHRFPTLSYASPSVSHRFLIKYQSILPSAKANS